MSLQELMPTLIASACDAFRQSFETFVENSPLRNFESLDGNLVSQVTSALQEASSTAAKTALRGFIESFEIKEELLIVDDKPYRFKCTSSKRFLTVLGELEINRRLYYHWAGGEAHVPLDEAWNMKDRYATLEVTEYALLSASMLTPNEIEKLFGKMCPFKPSASLIQDIINQDGAAFGRLLEAPEWREKARPVEIEDQAAVKALAVSVDGANVLIRAPGKKRGRPAERPGMKGRETTDPCSYKNAMVGAISLYTEGNNVIDFSTGEEVLVPQRISSIYHARMPEDKAPVFKAQFEELLARVERELPENVTKILLMDGARSLWNYAEQAPIYDSYIKIVDFFHAAEHLSKLGEALHGKESDEAKQWYERWVHKLKHEANAVESLLRSVTRYKGANQLSAARVADVKTEKTYFERNKDKMNYADLVSKGFPIGSGPVEAACKTVVKARFCQSGMRWTINGGQNVMNLRVVQKSGHWESSWKTYVESGGYRSNQADSTDLAMAA